MFDEIINAVNNSLESELGDVVLSPESGLQRVKKSLFRHRLDIPAILELNRESDEMVLPISSLEDVKIAASMYIIYALNEDGYYEFYAEMAYPDRIEELMSDEEEEAEE